MKKVSRRTFFSGSLGAAAALSLPGVAKAKMDGHLSLETEDAQDSADIIDTNVNLFEWPFRKLKYGKTKSLVEKLRKHRISQAWAGSFEALFYKDIHGVNARLAEECRANGEGMLLPFGTVNLAWPDWKEDLRRCHEVHKMPGIRIYPIYQTFNLEHPEFPELVKQVTARGMVLQIAGDMEDERHHHPIVEVRDVKLTPLIETLKQVPDAKLQLVYWNHRAPRNLLDNLIKETNVVFDTARVEGVGEVGRLIEGKTWAGTTTPLPVDRILFGSHAPYFPVEANVIKLFESPLGLQQMQAIMNGNARRFLKLA
ncbi:MAG: hypothetical protein WD824_08050 [Cyclobacteriaceae bacterium]